MLISGILRRVAEFELQWLLVAAEALGQFDPIG